MEGRWRFRGRAYLGMSGRIRDEAIITAKDLRGAEDEKEDSSDFYIPSDC